MSQCELPKPLGPGRKWGAVSTLAHGIGFALYDEDNMLLCSLWNLRKTSGLWAVWVTVKDEKSPWGTDRIVIDLGPHDSPPFELAEAIADAAR
jgi:hypothetical protein